MGMILATSHSRRS